MKNRKLRFFLSAALLVLLFANLTLAGRTRKYNGSYSGEYLNHIAFPLGGIGAGMVCIEGTGAISHVSVRNRPDIFNEPAIFAAICIKGKKNIARVLQGPVPKWKYFGGPDTGKGSTGKTYGLPGFANAEFKARFPFASVELTDSKIPLDVQITAWSPFTPPQSDDSSLPVAALEYRFINRTNKPIEAVFSFNSNNFMAAGDSNDTILKIKNGFVLAQPENQNQPSNAGWFAAFTDEPNAKVNYAWFRGGWLDLLAVAWNDIEDCNCYNRDPVTEGKPAPGASLFVPLKLKSREEKTITVKLAWYVPRTELRLPKDKNPATHKPWYSGRFKNIHELIKYWQSSFATLRNRSKKFTDCFYDTTLPAEVIEAIAANLTILKSPTILRQTDGRLWCWEGSGDSGGLGPGTCTHVWNYAQAIPHLFPKLERTLRRTEFNESQDEKGHQQFRAAIPIGPTDHDFHAASDGQLGGIMKIYRDWRISGDTEWLKNIWPKVKQSLDYCIETWDPEHNGVLSEPHHNTYDIELWGPDSMCSSFYLGALKAATEMAKTLGEDTTLYQSLFEKGKKYIEQQLFDGEYFYQEIKWKGLRAKDPTKVKSIVVKHHPPEALELLEKEGPRYQYGTGCLSDGVIGDWMALVCGLEPVLDDRKVKSHLKSVYKYNFRKNLSEHANPRRPGFAIGDDGGLILCTWPKGGRPTLPFIFSDEVWTGIEYQVASHMISLGLTDKAIEIIRTARDRYDGKIRNPFDEYEYGHWYARAMSSYALLQSFTGARYDAVEKILYLRPAVKGNLRAFLSTATGYGTVGVKNRKPFFETRDGEIEIKHIVHIAD